jgi:hypothetical protein
VIVEKRARETLTACELDIGDELRFTTNDKVVHSIRPTDTKVTLHYTDLPDPDARPLQARRGATTIVRMHGYFEIDGYPIELVRWVGSARSFYEPWTFMGLRIWLDAVDGLFTILSETHGSCRPRKNVRIAVQDASKRICPPLLQPWCPLPPERLRIDEAYDGGNCWLGPYFGAEAHGGLDINHPAGTPLWAPVGVDTQFLFDTLAGGANNNRWRGIRRWPDGSTWIIQAHHLIRTTVPPHTAVEAGVQIAETAGVNCGSHEHTHFVFAVVEPGSSDEDLIRLDPWILFRQMYKDRELTGAAESLS